MLTGLSLCPDRLRLGVHGRLEDGGVAESAARGRPLQDVPELLLAGQDVDGPDVVGALGLCDALLEVEPEPEDGVAGALGRERATGLQDASERGELGFD